MSSICRKLKKQIECLPPKDKSLCEKFIDEGKWENFYEVVKSCLFMKRQDLLSIYHKKKWQDIDEGKLSQLVIDVKDYITSAGISDLIGDIEEDFNDLEEQSGLNEFNYEEY